LIRSLEFYLLFMAPGEFIEATRRTILNDRKSKVYIEDKKFHLCNSRRRTI
jgi:hypothetical protein